MRRRLSPRGACFLLALCLPLLAAGSAFANALDMYGYGPRAVSMAGAVTGLADDYSAIYYNPAGLVANEGNTLAFGAMTARAFLDLDLKPAPGVTRRQAAGLRDLEKKGEDIKALDAGFMGFTSRLHERVAIGLLAFLPTDTVIRLHPIDSHIPAFVMYENRARRAVTYAGLAVQPVSAFSFGGGVSLFANCKGKFSIPIHVKDREVPAPDGGTNEPLDIASDLTLDFPYTYSPYAGVFVRPTEWLRLGAAYRGPFEWDVKVALDAELYLENYTIDLNRMKQLLPGLFPLKGVVEFSAPALGDKPLRVPLELEGLEGKVTVNAYAPVQMLAEMADHWKPHEVALGGSAAIGDAWTVSSDVTWQGWSQYPAPDLHFSIDDINVDISTLPASLRARIRTLTVPVLGTIGPLPPVNLAIPGLHTRLRLQFPMKETIKPKTHDIFIPRLGVEHRLPPIEGALWMGDLQFAARAGYAYEQSPFEPQRGYVNLVDADKHIFTAGFGVTVNRRISVDAYGEGHYLEPVRLEKDLIDPDYPFDAVEAGGYVLSTGASVSYHW